MSFDKRNFKKIALIVFLGIGLYWALQNITTLFSLLKIGLGLIAPFLTGLCLAFLINIILNALEKAWTRIFSKRKAKFFSKGKRPICLIFSILIVFLIALFIVLTVVPEIKKAIQALIVSAPSWSEHIENAWAYLGVFLGKHSIELPDFQTVLTKADEAISSFIAERGHQFANWGLGLASGIFLGATNLFFGLVFACYILGQKEKLGGQVQRISLAYLGKKKSAGIAKFFSLGKTVFSNFVTGQVTEALILGLLCFIGMKILFLPYAGMIATLIGATALIPVFGAWIGALIGAVLILPVKPSKALVFIIFIIILQNLEGDFIYPRVVGRSIGLPGIWVFLAVTLGGAAFGIPGMLLGVPLFAIAYQLIREKTNARLGSKAGKAPPDSKDGERDKSATE